MSDIFDAIADPTRRKILESLAGTPNQTVSDLVKLTKQGQPTVSKHLKVLRDAGLVKATAKGSNNHYSLIEKPLLDVLKWLGKVGVAMVEQNISSNIKLSKEAKNFARDLGRKMSEAKNSGEKTAKDLTDQAVEATLRLFQK